MWRHLLATEETAEPDATAETAEQEDATDDGADDDRGPVDDVRNVEKWLRDRSVVLIVLSERKLWLQQGPSINDVMNIFSSVQYKSVSTVVTNIVDPAVKSFMNVHFHKKCLRSEQIKCLRNSVTFNKTYLASVANGKGWGPFGGSVV